MFKRNRKRQKKERYVQNLRMTEFLLESAAIERIIENEPEPPAHISPEKTYDKIVDELKEKGKWKE